MIKKNDFIILNIICQLIYVFSIIKIWDFNAFICSIFKWEEIRNRLREIYYNRAINNKIDIKRKKVAREIILFTFRKRKENYYCRWIYENSSGIRNS